MAAGPGIPPRAEDAPWRAGRSARNYPHLVAERLGLDLVDVTYSGATTAHVLTDRQNGAPPQVDALDGSETLVTVTIGGNDVGYVPLLTAAGLPRLARSLPVAGWPCCGSCSTPPPAIARWSRSAESLKEVGRTVRQRAPRARVLFVDYLTLLPPPGEGRRRCRTSTPRSAATSPTRWSGSPPRPPPTTGCEVVRAAEASREHHAWSADPWTTKPTIRLAAARPPRAAAPQRGRHARRGRPGRRHSGELRSWAR